MSMVAQVKSRIEEVRARVMAIREGGSGLELRKEIQEKGVLTVLEEKFPRVREMRERGILASLTPEPKRDFEPKGEPTGKETEPLRAKSGSDTYVKDDIGVVT